ncbi:MAG: hypothetical protein R2771_00640 [Saprospiraceae bacterium]
MKLNTPTDDPPLNNGDVLSYTASIYPVEEDTPDDNIFKLNQTVVNSFDPNDKPVWKGMYLILKILEDMSIILSGLRIRYCRCS